MTKSKECAGREERIWGSLNAKRTRFWPSYRARHNDMESVEKKIKHDFTFDLYFRRTNRKYMAMPFGCCCVRSSLCWAGLIGPTLKWNKRKLKISPYKNICHVSYKSSISKRTRNVSKVHGYPCLTSWVINWPFSNLTTFTNMFIPNFSKPL